MSSGHPMSATNYYKFIQWDITSRCNLACIHCRSESFYGDEQLAPDLPLRDVKARLDGLHETGVRRIHFLGGEPFARSDLADIVRYATNLGIVCSVNTNATMINEARAEAIVDAGVFLVTVSIDGADSATNDFIRGNGSFAKILRGVENLRRASERQRANVRLVCSHVLMSPNVATVSKMVDLCGDIGIHNLIVTQLRSMGGARDRYDELAISNAARLRAAEDLVRRMKRGAKCNVQIEVLGLLEKALFNAKYDAKLPIHRSGCNATTSKGYVQPDGALFPCQDLAEAFGEKDRTHLRDSGKWADGSYAELPVALNSLELFKNYTPCRSCPALGALCVPCPLHGLRRAGTVVQQSCLRVMERAKRERVDLQAGIEAGISTSWRARLLQDPQYRRGFFAGKKQTANRSSREVRTAERFRDRVLAGLQDVLAHGQVGGPNTREEQKEQKEREELDV